MSESSAACECRRVNTVMLFVRKSYQLLLNSNFDAITKVADLQTDQFTSNSGFLVMLSYFGSFSILCLIGGIADRRELRGRRMKVLLDELKEAESETRDAIKKKEDNVYAH